jgi:hypothetical protein
MDCAWGNYTLAVVENENDSLYPYLVDIKEMYEESR